MVRVSEKLAQEGLRGNRDWLVVGKCGRAGVVKVAHDLERMRCHGGFLHRRERHVLESRTNTKLLETQEWYCEIESRQGLRPIFRYRARMRAGKKIFA